jgi:hypothetical protein
MFSLSWFPLRPIVRSIRFSRAWGTCYGFEIEALMLYFSSSPLYSKGIYSKTLSGSLKLWIVLNSIYSTFSYRYFLLKIFKLKLDTVRDNNSN